MTHRKHTIELLDELNERGFTNESFRRLHHMGESASIGIHRRYCEGLTNDFRPDNNNVLVERRLEFVLCSYRRFDLPPGKTDVFNALAEAAFLGIRPRLQ